MKRLNSLLFTLSVIFTMMILMLGLGTRSANAQSMGELNLTCELLIAINGFAPLECYGGKSKDQANFGECDVAFFQDLSRTCTGGCTCEVARNGVETKCTAGHDTFLIDCNPKNGSACFCASYNSK